MADYPDISKALFEKLTGTGAVTALVSTRIYDQYVPLGIARPYVVFYHAGGGPGNTVPRETIDTVFRVEAVGEDNPTTKAVFNAVFAALHGQTLTISGWSNYWTKVDGVRTLVDQVDGKQLHRRMADVQIKACEV